MMPELKDQTEIGSEVFREPDREGYMGFLKSRLRTVRNELVRHYLTISLGEGGVMLKEFLGGLEKQLIESALFISYGNQRRASAILGVKPTCLNEKIKRYGIGKLSPFQTVRSIEYQRDLQEYTPE